jgi:hypothetical protein
MLPGKSIVSPPKPSIPAPPPPPPTPEDPAILEAKRKLRQSELRRRGRAATILTPSEGELGETALSRPRAGSGTLG